MTEEHKILRKESRALTRESRKFLDCKVFEIKIQESKLSKEKKDYLNRLFLEAKWFYNTMLSSDDVFKFDYKTKVAQVINKDGEKEEREIKALSAQMRQEIKHRCMSSIKALSTKKKNGRSKEVGKLKFKSRVSSIPLNSLVEPIELKTQNTSLFRDSKSISKLSD